MRKPGWLSEHFHSDEFRCHDTQGTPVPKPYLPNLRLLVSQLEIIRAACGGNPVIIRSGYRTPEYNRDIGGATRSKHLLAQAADLVVVSRSPKQVHKTIRLLIAAGALHDGGLGMYDNFVHYDVSTSRRWKG